MNVVIQNLIDQATESVQINVDTVGDPIYRKTFSIDKFAELLIKECISICKEKEHPNLYGVREVENTIKQHFNIE